MMFRKDFADCLAPGDVKSLYRKLAKLHHPDCGGDEEVFKVLNNEYHARLEALNGFVSQGFDGKEHTYRYNFDIEQAVIDKVYELLALKLSGVNIEVVGTWVWVSGNTKPVKDKLKDTGLWWHGKRQMWYWRLKNYRTTYSGIDFNTLRQVYGSKKFDQDEISKAVVAA